MSVSNSLQTPQGGLRSTISSMRSTTSMIGTGRPRRRVAPFEPDLDYQLGVGDRPTRSDEEILANSQEVLKRASGPLLTRFCLSRVGCFASKLALLGRRSAVRSPSTPPPGMGLPVFKAVLPRRSRFLAACILLLLSAAQLRALDPALPLTQLRLDSWSTGRGYPGGAVRALLADGRGYVWVGGETGLFRFDGERFDACAGKRLPELGTGGVEALAGGKDGNLWVALKNRGVFKLAGDQFRQVVPPSPQGGPRVTGMRPVSDDRVWLATGDGLLDQGRGAARRYSSGEGLAGDDVTGISESSRGEVFIATRTGLSVLVNGRFENYFEKDGLPSQEVVAVAASADGGAWVATSKGLVRISNGKTAPAPAPAKLSPARVSSLVEDRDGCLWVGTLGAGLWRFGNGAWSQLDIASGLPGNTVLCVSEDRDGNVWAGMGEGVLVRVSGSPVAAFTRLQGLSTDDVRCVTERGGEMWLGLADGSLYRIGGGGVPEEMWRSAVAGRGVLSMMVDSRGRFWVGLENGDVKLFPPEGGMKEIQPPEGVTGQGVHAFFEDGAGRLWAAVGNCLASYRDGRFIAIPIGEASAGEQVRSILEEPSGTLVLGTDSGIVRIMPDGRVLLTDHTGGLQGREVRDIFRDVEGTFFVAFADAGLCVIRGGTSAVVGRKEGLPADSVSRILDDKKGNFWLGTPAGVVCVPKQSVMSVASGQFTRLRGAVLLGVADGSRCAGGSQPAGWVSSAGTVWVPTMSGLLSIRPDRIPDGKLLRAPIIEGVDVSGVYYMGDKPLRLPFGTERLAIDYTVFGPFDPSQVRFRYRLEGYETEWVMAGMGRQASYASLPPGEYRFQASASADGERWVDSQPGFRVQITAPFYRYPWFFLYSTVTLSAAAVFWVVWWVRRLKKRATALSDLLAENEIELVNTREEARSGQRSLSERDEEIGELKGCLAKIAHMDGLTGLYSRAYFSQIMDQVWRRGCRTGNPVTLLLVDIDQFRMYNEHYGPASGDDCLRKVARTLSRLLKRAGDAVARYDGGRFAILLESTGLSGGEQVAECVRAEIENLGIPFSGRSAGVITASIGLSSQTAKVGRSPIGLTAEADDALDVARKSGGNRVAPFGRMP